MSTDALDAEALAAFVSAEDLQAFLETTVPAGKYKLVLILFVRSNDSGLQACPRSPRVTGSVSDGLQRHAAYRLT